MSNEFLAPFDIDLHGIETPGLIQPPGEIRKLLEPTGDHPDDYILALDWSTFSQYLSCAQSGEYLMIWARNFGTTPALTYGRAIHKALEIIYHAKAENSQPDWTQIQSAIHQEYEGMRFDNDWRTPERAIEVAAEYFVHYQNEPYSVYNYGGAFIEKPFSYSLCAFKVENCLPFAKSTLVKGCEDDHSNLYVRRIIINWTGVLDLALVSRDDNVWPMDHKTTSMAGPAFFKAFELSGQFIGYAAAFRHLLGFVPQGMIGNFIIGRKPTLKGKGKTLELERQIYTYEPWQLDQWANSMVYHMEKFVEDLKRGVFGENPTACSNKYGLCKYFSTCSANPEDRKTHLFSDNYVYNVWNPLD